MKSHGAPLHYGCFVCRKSFKRPQLSGSINRFMTSEQAIRQRKESERFGDARQYKCPHCGGPAHFMGMDLKAPKRQDTKEWQAVKNLYVLESFTIGSRRLLRGVDSTGERNTL